MRNSPILDALFPTIRGKLLSAILAQPSREWYLTEIANFVGTRPSSLQREVDSLSKAGILVQRRDGRRIYLKSDLNSPVFDELKSFFDKTAGLIAVLSAKLKPFNESLRLAFVYGSIAHSMESSSSDVDLMVVGDIGLAALVPALRETEHALGRPVNPTVYSSEEFSAKARSGDHFLTSVLAGKIQFVKGDKDELDQLVR